MFDPLAFVLGVSVGATIGGIVLRAACWCYNAITSESKDKPAVPEPGFVKAMLIAFFSAVTVIAVQVAIAFVGGAGTGFSPKSAMLLTCLPPVSGVVVMSILLAQLLPTSSGNAVGIAFTMLGMGFALSLILFVLVRVLAG